MALPKQSEVEIPLLSEIAKAGGRAKPRELYPRLAALFPHITEDDLKATMKDGHNRWANTVQWARQALVLQGELDRSTKGIWAITEKGRNRIEKYPDGEPGNANRRGRGKVMARQRPAGGVAHDEIARALEKMGRAFGFEAVWKPRVNELRPVRSAFKAKHKTLDVAWKIANLTWVPIEVQVAGSVPDLMFRFQQVHQWSVRLVVVTVPRFEDEVREAITGYPFQDKIVILTTDRVLAAAQDLDHLLELRDAIFSVS